ncbi:MAG TPA: ABC transporter permease [Gemmatimonadaceae bacterium]|jgi:ABC-type multidrug transport system permease subunit
MTEITGPVQPTRRFVEHSLVQLTLARFRGFIREPEAVFWTFVFPILLAVGLGVAFRSRPPERLRIAVVTSEAASGIVEPLKRDSSLIVEVMDDSSAARALRTGKIALVAKVTGPSSVEYVYDPVRGDAASAKLLVDRSVQHTAGLVDPVRVAERKVTERGSRYIDFVLPGLLGMNLMGSGIWGIGFAIVDQRAKKLLKRFMATPMSRAEYLASFMFSRLFFLVLEVVTLLGFGVLVFGVPLRGSIAALGAICLLAAMSFAGMGLLISSRARTTEGVSGLMNLVMLPMWIFSGVFFSSSNFPQAVQPVIKLLPLTAVNDALRANMLEGTSFAGVSGQMLVIAGWLLLSFFLALKLFRWR